MGGRPSTYQHRSDPAEALRRLALETPPPSRIDIAKAATDGFRLRRRRRITRSLTGAAAAGVVAAAGVLLPGHLGAGQLGNQAPDASQTSASSSAVCRALVGENEPPSGDYHSQVPGAFGWLPADQVSQITETFPTYDTGSAISGIGPYIATAAPTTSSGAGIYLTVYAYAAQVPGQQTAPPPGCPSTLAGSTTGYQIAAPNVNGGKAYWFSLHQGVVDDAGTAELVWRTAAGTWASVSGSGLDPDTVEATLEHVARTATVGTVAVPTPLQFRGVPSHALLQLDQVVVSQGVAGDPKLYSVQVFLTIGTGYQTVPVEVSLYPVGEDPYTGDVSRHCETVSNWHVCAGSMKWAEIPEEYLPGGETALLHDLVVQGQDPSTWSADLITGTT